MQRFSVLIVTSRRSFSRSVPMSSWSFCSFTFHSALCRSRFRSFSMSREWRCDSRSSTLSSFRLLVAEREERRNLECFAEEQKQSRVLWVFLTRCREAVELCCQGFYEKHKSWDLAQRSLLFKRSAAHYKNNTSACLARRSVEAAPLSVHVRVDGRLLPGVKLCRFTSTTCTQGRLLTCSELHTYIYYKHIY